MRDIEFGEPLFPLLQRGDVGNSEPQVIQTDGTLVEGPPDLALLVGKPNRQFR
jgi:hypothetical protein